MNFSEILRPVLDQIKKLWDRVDQVAVTRWGTVTSGDPLRVILDGSPDALPFAPQSAVRGLSVGDRVVCVEQHRRVIVVQVAGRWVPFAVASGSGSVNALAGVGTSIAVVFPPGKFTAPPNIQLTIGPSTEYMGDRSISLISRSATGFTVGVSNLGAEIVVPFMWESTQMSADSADG